MKKIVLLFLITSVAININAQHLKIRNQKDTVGFASKAWQMDSVINRLMKRYGKYYDSLYKKQNVNGNEVLRFAICPHDDYAYAGFLYNELFPHIKANIVIILGVAHKAKKFGIEKKIVFDTFEQWNAAGSIKISPLREQIMNNLPQSDYIVHDSLQIEEHSVEAFVPFLQHYIGNRVEVISILVPYMPFSTMFNISLELAESILKVMKNNSLKWGKDVALLVSTDAVHYGDEDWGGKNFAPYGCDTAGYKAAAEHEQQIIKDCLVNPDTSGAKKFFDYTVQSSNWHDYKWTWCGRYSVPFGILTAYQLQQLSGETPLKLILSDYSTSIAHKPLKVEDLNMGTTAIATIHHWVGYALAGFK